MNVERKMTKIVTTSQKPLGLGRFASGAAISTFVFGTVFAGNAIAHEDITDAILTERSTNCADYVNTYSANVTDVQADKALDAAVEITMHGDTCTISSNAVPNHDFNATGRFVTPLAEKEQVYTISANPTRNDSPTALSLRTDNAVFLNGVKLDLIAAGCFGVGDGNIGCFQIETPYRYDPMGTGSRFGADEHNAHTQPDGTYHYHGNPVALFEQINPTSASPVIGFAADGFPIFGSYIADGDEIRVAKSSYQLKAGERSGGPGGTYDGTFIDDWEFVEGSGDLDECNGMEQDGVYGYVVTAIYPHVLGCFAGTPHESFKKAPPR